MLFVKTEDLKPGMRLAKPIYNRNGVMLYERNSKITSQGIISVNNFGLIGIYILEPAEPVPPMSEDDIEFERFQAMSIFEIKEILDAYSEGKKENNMYQFINQLLKKYGSLHHKINFIQNIRRKKTIDLTMEDEKKITMCYQNSYDAFKANLDLSPDIKRILSAGLMLLHPDIPSATENVPKVIGAEILKVANCFDNMTAMKFGDEPLSEIAAIRYLLEMEDQFDRKIVDALLDSINILSPGVCVEFTNGDKGLVVTANDSNVLEPFVLSFKDNKLYNLADSKVAEQMKIKDIMKTMDNRHVVDREFLSQYMGKTLHMGEK